ncbi:hypothetical protein PPL_00261 [Heterostelium album PN500]|uniref:Uncharacterized protein n=1 Tax=Heterostelium pallidum (strain ATCC 26659 / Pp 5 / PN500) TaxID=670386 RepID=D3AVZ5_HETP5|nr:hypothetical protein PPL_00261 [Heterostelium album PN500]EFA86468.1 hypothetical protein PPL_00261 [Heterostelium album PN500]|eukprot:XP_020438573.1 hypothetical protein PPL_00261 [Heterostelium album PN500]
MKLIFTLLVLVACVAARQPCQQSKGYTTQFELSAFNTFFPTGSSNVALSFYEAGNTTTDFDGQRTRSDWIIIMEGQPPMVGSIWEFGQTGEGYVYQNGICVKMSLNYPIPAGFPLQNFVGVTRIGNFPVEVYTATGVSPSVLTNQTFLFDPKSCSVVSSTLRNADAANPGFAVMNFFNYENYFIESWFDLPAECTQSSVTKNIPHAVNPHHTNFLKYSASA